MARARKADLSTERGREAIFLEVIDHMKRYTPQERKWIAQEAEVSNNTIYNWLEFKTFSPQIRTLASIARVLGYEVALKRIRHAPPVPRQKGRIRRVK